jgi:hypothetical protein
MSLTLKALKKKNIECTLNGEKMLERKQDLLQETEQKLASGDEIQVGQWKRVEIEVKGQKKSVMKIVDSIMKPQEFLTHLRSQIEEFDQHVMRIKTQYSEMKNLKENLPVNHCIIHMDFSENYSCKSVQEIQSAYWNQTAVTLHPVVIYFKTEASKEILHQSFVFVSDEMGHNANTVLTIIDKLIPAVKQLIPEVTCIHYWTDSPTSQYRNKLIFRCIANHNSTYGIHAKWNYWEAGHGKGPCDGLGGRVKRLADEAVNTGKVCIQDPSDFYAWSQSVNCTMKNVKFVFVSTEECENKAKENNQLNLKPIVGTMKLHAVVGKGDNCVAVRNTSCYCTTCLSHESATCSTWRNETLVSKVTAQSSNEDESSANKPGVQSITTEKAERYDVDDYIAALYLGRWYIGKIITVDEEDSTFEVTFLQQKKRMFQWPSRPDVIWVDYSDILCKVSTPVTSGKSKRMLLITDSDIDKVEILFVKK